MSLRDTEALWDAVPPWDDVTLWGAVPLWDTVLRTARTKPLVAPTILKGAHWRGCSAHGHHQRRLRNSACLPRAIWVLTMRILAAGKKGHKKDR
jgi:hypothetical protein